MNPSVGFCMTNGGNKQTQTIEFVLWVILICVLFAAGGVVNSIYAIDKQSDHMKNSDKVYVLDMGNLKIDRFGISGHQSVYLILNPVNTVGGSIPTNSEQLFSYLFYTNNGIYAVSFNEDPATTHSTSRLVMDSSGCITSSTEIESADVQENFLILTDVESQLSDIDKVQTVQFNMDDDQTCIARIFDTKN